MVDIPMPPIGQQQNIAPMPQPQPQSGGGKLHPAVANDTSHVALRGTIPGQSWTKPHGEAPYEKPPRFAHPHDAATFIFSQMLNPSTAKGMLTLLKQGVPAEALAKVLLFSGFSQGYWTPDVSMILFPVVLSMIVAMGHKAKIDTKIAMQPRSSDMAITQALKGSPLTKPEDNSMPMNGKNMDNFTKAVRSLGSKPSADELEDNE